jgi:hypothetical protein
VKKIKKIDVEGRSARTGRPSVQHLLNDYQATITACGVDVSEMSRSFQNDPIESILCLKSACRA